jgi:cytochrome c oxidase assembly protein subunit 15
MSLFHGQDQSRATALWLFSVAALVFSMVVLGGATRLTESGLSITEWAPVTGVIPPLNHQDWLNEFQKYQRIPQYQFVNRGMSLGAFQGIYWWEWTHRLVGRLVGVAFILPFVALLASKQIPRRLVWRCWLLLGLGALQGLVGWWMVASGLEGRVEVAPERLAIHLGLALVLFSLLIWTALEALFGQGRSWPDSQRWRWPAAALAALVFLQIMLGALVAGDRAGQVYNDWPLMNGRIFPDDYLGRHDLGWALLHSQAAVQFNHRLTAYILILGAIVAAVLARRTRSLPRSAPTLAVILAGLVVAQAALGIATLMTHAPLWLALPHQCMAALVLAVALSFAWRVRRA